MIGPGFLGTSADCMLDFVIVSQVLILPLLFYSISLIKKRKYQLHAFLQTTIFVVLAIVVAIFEWDMKMQGGVFEQTKASRFAGSLLLNGTIYVHLASSILTSVVWIGLVAYSIKYIGLMNPQPGHFSAKHRLLGKAGVWLMVSTAVTGVMVYVLGFVF